ncbi:MAG: hypothetical protein GY906_24935 [bacterium]|nr:hypothetical protein [bacterium]
MAGAKDRRKGETHAQWEARMRVSRAAEAETERASDEAATVGEQRKGIGDVAEATGGKAEAGPMPKQSDYDSTKEWTTALRKWREKKRAK